MKDTSLCGASLVSSMTMAKNMNALIGGGLCTPQAVKDPNQLVYKKSCLQISLSLFVSVSFSGV